MLLCFKRGRGFFSEAKQDNAARLTDRLVKRNFVLQSSGVTEDEAAAAAAARSCTIGLIQTSAGCVGGAGDDGQQRGIKRERERASGWDDSCIMGMKREASPGAQQVSDAAGRPADCPAG